MTWFQGQIIILLLAVIASRLLPQPHDIGWDWAFGGLAATLSMLAEMQYNRGRKK